MNGFISSRLGRRFLGMFLLLMLPVASVGWLGMEGATSAIRRQTHAVLRAAADGAEAQLREFLLCLRRTTEAFATEDYVHTAADHGTAGTQWEGVLEKLQARLPEAQEVFCLDTRGRVIATSSPGLANRDFSGSDIFARGRQSFYAGDLARDPVDRQIHWRMSAPVTNAGRFAGVMVIGVDPAVLTALSTGKRVLDNGADTQSFRMGETGETYIVNREGYLITQSRFASDGILKVKVATKPAQVWRVQGVEMIGDYKDYRGVTVSGATAILKEPSWLMVTEVDFTQAFAPIMHLRRVLLVLSIGALVVAALLGTRFARRIVRPVQALSDADQALARGDEKGVMVSEGALPENEIGDFIRMRNSRIREHLERQQELTRAQRARAAAAAELEKITYSMVHDMRAPLRAVIAFGDLLAQEAGKNLDASGNEYIQRMQAACSRMDQLICDMLRYSSLLQQDMPLTSINVPALVRDLAANHPPFAEKRQCITVQPDIPAVSANRAALRECLMALLDNALTYAKPGSLPKVTVSAEPAPEKMVRIVVEDNGVGIPAPLKPQVFGIFQRGTNAQKGTGIGLAVVRVAVERMGGRVGVESEEGKGSRFWMDLQRADRQA